MNVSEEKKNEILKEVKRIVTKYYDIEILNYITINPDGSVFLFSGKPHYICGNGFGIISPSYWNGKFATTFNPDGDAKNIVAKLLLDISTDWTELCFELPKPKKKWESEESIMR